MAAIDQESIDSLDELDRAPLHWAALVGRADVTEALLERGAAVNLVGMLGTPLHEAARRGFGDVVRVLLANGADARLRDPDGAGVINLALGGPAPSAGGDDRQAQMLELLLENGAAIDVFAAARLPGQETLRGFLASDPELVSAVDSYDRTPLHHAADRGNPDAVALLLRAGAGVDARNREGRTPLHHAAWRGHAIVVALLLEGGAEIEAERKDGATALYMAIEQGRHETAELLIEKGAEVDVQDKYGWSPLHKAAVNGDASLVELLLGAGANPTLRTGSGDDGLTPADAARNYGQEDLARRLEAASQR